MSYIPVCAIERASETGFVGGWVLIKEGILSRNFIFRPKIKRGLLFVESISLPTKDTVRDLVI